MTQSPRTLPQGDDGAPVDVTYVSSVAQGVRARQERGMHDAAPRPAVRRRAMPQGGVGDYGARQRPDAPLEEKVARSQYVIDTDRPLDQLRADVQKLYEAWLN